MNDFILCIQMGKKKIVRKNISKRKIAHRKNNNNNNNNNHLLDIKHNPHLLQNPYLSNTMQKMGTTTDQRSINNDMLKVMLSRAPIGVQQDPAIHKMQNEIARLHGNNDYKQQFMDVLKNAKDQEYIKRQQLDQDKRQFDVRKKSDAIAQKIDNEKKKLDYQIEDYQREIDKDQKDAELVQKREELKSLKSASEANKQEIEDNRMFREYKRLCGDIDQLQVQLSAQQAIMKSPEFIKPSEALIAKHIEKERLNQRLKIEQQAFEEQQRMNNMKAQLDATRTIRDNNFITKDDRDRMAKAKKDLYKVENALDKANDELKYRKQYKRDIKTTERDTKYKQDIIKAMQQTVDEMKPTDEEEAQIQAAISEKAKTDQEHNRLMKEFREQEKQRQAYKELQESNKKRKLENEQQRQYNDAHQLTDNDRKQYNEALKKKLNVESEAKQLQAEEKAYNDFHNEMIHMQAKTNIRSVQNDINRKLIQDRKAELMSKDKQDEYNKIYTEYANTQKIANANKRQMAALDRRDDDIAKYQEDTEHLNRENAAKQKWIEAKEQDMQSDQYKNHLRTMAETRVATDNRQKQLDLHKNSLNVKEKANVMLAQIEAAKRFGQTDDIPDAEVLVSIANQIEDAVKDNVENQIEYERVKHAYNLAKSDTAMNANYHGNEESFTQWLNDNLINRSTDFDLTDTKDWQEADYKRVTDLLNFMQQPKYKNFANDQNALDNLAIEFDQFAHIPPDVLDDDDFFA